MRLLKILPIARGIRTEALTYFGSEDIALGTIVSIPVRKKEVSGIIIDSSDALEAKAEIKEMSFAIKKIKRCKNDPALPSYLMNGAKKIAEECAASMGATLAALIPKIALENPTVFFKLAKEKQKKDQPVGIRFEILAIQSANADRFDMYRSIIRESFARKLSVALICPSRESALETAPTLSRGIEKYTLPMPSIESKRSLAKWIEASKDTSHPILLAGTSAMLALLPESLGTIIVEGESSQFYKERRRPYLDMRHAAIALARGLDVRIIFGDSLLSIETQAKVRDGKTQEYARLSKRNVHKIQTLLVDMKPKDESEKKDFRVLSTDLEEMIRYAEKSKKRLLIYSARRGIATQTVCRDCGTTVLCEKCEASVVLHTKQEEKRFVCHHCGTARSALEQCKNCGSWNLFSYGIGIERIIEEIQKISGANTFRIDSDTTKSVQEVKSVIKEFSEKGGILVTTDLGLKFLAEESVDFSAIPSLDSLASFPDFRTNERAMHTILDIKSKARECMLVQSRDMESDIIEQALAGDLDSFSKDELKARKEFGYPPFVRIIKLTITGKKEAVRVEAGIVTEKLRAYNPVVFPAFIKAIKGETLLHIMLKIPREKWPDKALSEILLSFPPSVRIDTSPTSLL